MIGTAPIEKKVPQSWVIAAFAAIYLIWGSTYIAIVFAIRDIPPLIMAGTRFLAAGLILYTFSRIRGESTPSFHSIRKISVGGILMLFFGTGSVAWVEQYIPSGLAAIVVAVVPLWFVLFDKRNWKTNFSSKWIISGLLIGFIGVILLVADKGSFDLNGDRMKIVSFFVLVFGNICWAIGSLYSKYQTIEGSTGMKVSIQMITAGVASIVAGVISGEHHHIDWMNISRDSLLALLYLITVGSLIGYLAYVWLLSVRPPTLVGTYAYVNPVVAVFLGWLLVGETITRQQVIALFVILSGVVLVQFAKPKKQLV